MPRPQRIEYENAFYHVMNRGRVIRPDLTMEIVTEQVAAYYRMPISKIRKVTKGP